MSNLRQSNDYELSAADTIPMSMKLRFLENHLKNCGVSAAGRSWIRTQMSDELHDLTTSEIEQVSSEYINQWERV